MKVRRPGSSRTAIAPLVGEVILVAICVILSTVILFAAGAIAPDSPPEPSMAFTQVKRDSFGIRLTLSESIPSTEFIQFKLIALSPDANDPLVATFNGSACYRLNDTITLNLVDLAGDGIVSKGDYLTITSSSAFESGIWIFHMIFLSTGSASASISLNVY